MTEPDPKLTPATPEDLAQSLSFALRFEGRKSQHDSDRLNADIVAKRLVRYLWAEATDLEKLVAEGGDWPSEAVFASLFRDLGVAGLDAAPGPATMADRAPAQHEARMNAASPASPESEPDRRHSMAFMDLEPKIRDLTHMAELARFHAIDTFGPTPSRRNRRSKNASAR
jgi:hypothetical protein